MRTRKARIGDVCEIQTPKGLGYVQYTHEHPDMGQLVRILPGLFLERPIVSELVKTRELYFTFYVLNHAIRKLLASVVSNEPIPEWAKTVPLMRFDRSFDRIERPNWLIADAFFELTVENLKRTLPHLKHVLTPEEETLSIHALWGHQAMVDSLVEGWTPSRDREICLRHRAEKERQQYCDPGLEDSNLAKTKYYLYFKKKSNADQASETLCNKYWVTEVKRSADRRSWLLLTSPPETLTDVSEVDEELERLARTLDGNYDGSSTQI